LVGIDLTTMGIPTEEEYVADYCRRTGRPDVEHWDFYLAFALFRLAAIAQGVYKRGLDGNASSEQAMTYGSICQLLAYLAWTIVEKRDR
jgi:aminoglycoside phosphotransferase (APT) family kinase protein